MLGSMRTEDLLHCQTFLFGLNHRIDSTSPRTDTVSSVNDQLNDILDWNLYRQNNVNYTSCTCVAFCIGLILNIASP